MYTEVVFFIKCKGRNAERKEVLKEPVNAEVRIHGVPESQESIHLDVNCPHAMSGGHGGEYCNASHGAEVKNKTRVHCPYAIDLPYSMDNIKSE